MKTYDVYCPICGTLNMNLDMEETEGWMECSGCGNVVQLPEYEHTRLIPLYTPAQLIRRVRTGLPLCPSEGGKQIDMVPRPL